MSRVRALFCAGLAVITTAAFPATFVVPSDRLLVQRADAIIVGGALASRTEEAGDILVTITTFSVQEVLKGSIREDTIEVRSPGGVLDDRAVIIPGAPRFIDGDEHLLFLIQTGDTWLYVRDLALGKFTFGVDAAGKRLALRDETEVNGWTEEGKVYVEKRRDAESFLRFVRAVVAGGPAREDYFVPRNPLVAVGNSAARTGLLPFVNATFSANSYLMISSGSAGARWNVFPSAVSWFSYGTEPGAPGGGTTAINAAFAAWNNDTGSNVNYVYSGTRTSTAGLSASDGANTIAFERDLTGYGVPRFICTANSYSGTLGMGGITRPGAAHQGPNNELFVTALEGDVEMNQGIANCTLLLNGGDFNSAVAHEVGHTLGFRHSDMTRNDSAACSSDPSLDCSATAIMKSFVASGLNATLQPWDERAVRAVYPGASSGGNVNVSALVATPDTSTRVVLQWGASGAGTFEVLRRGPGSTAYTVVGTSSSASFIDTSVAPNTAYLYKIRSGTNESNADLATTVSFTDDPLVAGVTRIKAVHLAELRTAVNAVRALAGIGAASFTDAAAPGVVVRATHIVQLRDALRQALEALGLPTPGWTGALSPGVIIRAVHFQEIRNAVK